MILVITVRQVEVWGVWWPQGVILLLFRQVEVWGVWWLHGVRLVLLNRLRFGEYGGHREWDCYC